MDELERTGARALSIGSSVNDASGVLVGTAPRTIAANGTGLVPRSTMVSAGGSGSASITFIGPPGSIAANVTTLGGATGLSFGAAFTPRANLGTFGSLQ